MERLDGVERYSEDADINPLIGFGVKAEIPANDLEKTLSAIQKQIEEQIGENRQLRLEIKKLKDANLKLMDRLDTQDLINTEIFKKLSAIEDGEIDSVPSAVSVNLIEYKGLDPKMASALMYLEKKGTLYVRDIKRLDIMFKFNRQYIRYLHKIGKIAGYPVKQTKSGLWYVEKSEPSDNDF